MTREILAIDHRLEQEAVLGVLCDAEVGRAGCEEVAGELDEDRHAVSALFLEDQLLDGGKRGERGQSLWRAQSAGARAGRAGAGDSDL